MTDAKGYLGVTESDGRDGMVKVTSYAIVIGVLALSACAKQPDAIGAVSVSQNEYRPYSCGQLANAKLTETQNLANLSAAQKDAAAGDAFGVFLLGLPLSSMSGGDKETMIAVTKGKLQAIEQQQQTKRCTA